MMVKPSVSELLKQIKDLQVLNKNQVAEYENKINGFNKP